MTSASLPLAPGRLVHFADRGVDLARLRDASRQSAPAFRPMVERAEDRAVASWLALLTAPQRLTDRRVDERRERDGALVSVPVLHAHESGHETKGMKS